MMGSVHARRKMRWCALASLGRGVLSYAHGDEDAALDAIRVVKLRAYQAWGIPRYWVIDRFESRALVWSPSNSEPAVVIDELHWQPRQDVDALVVPLADIGLGEPA